MACESADPTILGGEGLTSDASTSSETSSSISVVSVPFEVTGDGPTISLGLVICKPFVECSSIEFGRRWEDSWEFRVDLAYVSRRTDSRACAVHTMTDIAESCSWRGSWERERSLYKERMPT